MSHICTNLGNSSVWKERVEIWEGNGVMLHLVNLAEVHKTENFLLVAT